MAVATASMGHFYPLISLRAITVNNLVYFKLVNHFKIVKSLTLKTVSEFFPDFKKLKDTKFFENGN